MKRYGDLWDKITAFQNIYRASQKAQRGKRFKHSVLAFNYRLEDQLHILQQELILYVGTLIVIDSELFEGIIKIRIGWVVEFRGLMAGFFFRRENRKANVTQDNL